MTCIRNPSPAPGRYLVCGQGRLSVVPSMPHHFFPHSLPVPRIILPSSPSPWPGIFQASSAFAHPLRPAKESLRPYLPSSYLRLPPLPYPLPSGPLYVNPLSSVTTVLSQTHPRASCPVLLAFILIRSPAQPCRPSRQPTPPRVPCRGRCFPLLPLSPQPSLSADVFVGQQCVEPLSQP